MDNPLAAIFTLTIRDNSDNPKITTIPSAGKVWLLLAQLNGNCYIFDWQSSKWLVVSYAEYQDFRHKNYSLEIKANQSRQPAWLELPMTGHPKREQKANHRISKSEHQALARLSTDSGLKQYLETERLLDDLISDY